MLVVHSRIDATEKNFGFCFLMFDQLSDLFQFDWRIFMAATEVWRSGGNPYGAVIEEFGRPGAFAYPPTALSWLWCFLPLGGASFYVWTALQLGGWWLLIRQHLRSQLVLLCWAPLIVHLVLGQSTLGVVLVLWAATIATRRGWWWGIALAWTLTKPQTALLPIVWILWHDRHAPQRAQLWLGLVLGTLALALPPTILKPTIWLDWLHSLSAYRVNAEQAAPWQGLGWPILLVAFGLWYRKFRECPREAGWQWLLTSAIFPQASLYPAVVLLPLLRPQQSYWTLLGLGLAGMLVVPIPAAGLTLPMLLASHILAAWLIAGGPRGVHKELASLQPSP